MGAKSEFNLTSVLKSLIILLPSVLVMYGLYYAETNQLWENKTKIRDLVTIAFMGTGLMVSFAVFTVLNKRK